MPPDRAQTGANGVRTSLRDVGLQVDEQRPTDQERADVDEQRGGGARRANHHASESRTQHERGGEGDVQRRIRRALGLLHVVLEARVRPDRSFRPRFDLLACRPRNLGTQECAGGQRGRPVEGRQEEHRRQPEVPQKDREPGGHDRLEEIQPAEFAAVGGRLDARHEHGHDEGGQGLRGEQQRRYRQRAVRMVEDGE